MLANKDKLYCLLSYLQNKSQLNGEKKLLHTNNYSKQRLDEKNFQIAIR